ncbi:MAG: tripartite tricarboxylate transporter permease [Candidatus Riflemargulisbacteria bacterium]
MDIITVWLQNMALGAHAVFNFWTFFLLFLGVTFGIIVGAMPGLSPSLGVALMLPLTFGLDPMNALIILVAVYLAANYGGSITAIIINTPGTAGSFASTFDGYELTRQGKPGLALGASIYAATVGGVIGGIFLMLFSGPVAKMALACGSFEYFALAVFGLSIISSLSNNKPLHGLVAVAFGLLVMTIGVDSQLSLNRFTFGLSSLEEGIPLIPALIGLFALGQIFHDIEKNDLIGLVMKQYSAKLLTWKQIWSLRKVTFISSLIGTTIGAIPGAGSAIASIIAYSQAKRVSKTPEDFGKGSLEGVAAPEAANCSSVGGALIPLLTLGIPGSASCAVMLGALMMHKITPGPELFKPAASGGHPELVYGIFISLFLANIIMFILGLLGNRLWVRIINVPRAVVYSIIIVMSFIGSYFVSNSFSDVWICFVFGIISWLFKRSDIPVAPVILAIVLGKMIEDNLRLSLVRGSWFMIFDRPVALIVLLIAVITFVWPYVKMLKAKKSQMV